MSDIVLSASVRQNLLSLQSTASLLSTTQSRLATGKKVNSALDNPTNFFTAASLDSRASDINNLLDGIGNGVQVLQAANPGISSLQKLVDSGLMFDLSPDGTWFVITQSKDDDQNLRQVRLVLNWFDEIRRTVR